MLQIDRLRLENFRRFRECALELEPDVTVLVGENGSGKTALLDAASIALGSILGPAIARRVPSLSTPTIRAQDAAAYNVDEFFRERLFPVVVEASGRLGDQEQSWSRELRGSGGRTTTANARPAAQFGQWIADVSTMPAAQAGGDLPLMAYYGATRSVKETSLQRKTVGKASRLQAYAGCLAGGTDYRQVLDWITRAEFDSARGAGNWRPVLDAIYAAIRTTLKPERVSWVGANLELGGLAVRTDTGLRSLSELSDGYRAVIALTADLAWRAGMLNPHLGEDAAQAAYGTVLIDELDLYLHPSWQARALVDLRAAFPGVQLVIATHSPYLVSTVERRQLRRLVRVTNGALVEEVQSETWGRSVDFLVGAVLGAPNRADVPPAQDLGDLGEALARRDVPKARDLAQKVRRELAEDADARRALRQLDALEGQTRARD